MIIQAFVIGREPASIDDVGVEDGDPVTDAAPLPNQHGPGTGRPLRHILGASVELLIRAIAYRLQEKAFAGLKPSTLRVLDRIAGNTNLRIDAGSYHLRLAGGRAKRLIKPKAMGSR
jgi:hypothetical protein